MTTVGEPVAGAGAMVVVRAAFRDCAGRAAVVSRPGLWERLGAYVASGHRQFKVHF